MEASIGPRQVQEQQMYQWNIAQERRSIVKGEK
jgi:hypothetical protein